MNTFAVTVVQFGTEFIDSVHKNRWSARNRAAAIEYENVDSKAFIVENPKLSGSKRRVALARVLPSNERVDDIIRESV